MIQTMNLTLAEFLLAESAEIFEQQDAINRICNLYAELKERYDQIDADETITTTAAKTSKLSPTIELDEEEDANSVDERENGEAKRENNSSPISTSGSCLLGGDEIGSKSCQFIDRTNMDTIGPLINGSFGCAIGTSIATATSSTASSSKFKNHERTRRDDYRAELLRQIDEKRQRKQREIEREREAEYEIEKKIARQRLSMYLDYVEERKRGTEYVGRKLSTKSIESQNLVTGGSLPNIALRSNRSRSAQSARKCDSKSTSSDNDAVAGSAHSPDLPQISVVQDKIRKASIKPADTSIISNLSEVRKIMQNDHIEMLEKLLEMKL